MEEREGGAGRGGKPSRRLLLCPLIWSTELAGEKGEEDQNFR